MPTSPSIYETYTNHIFKPSDRTSALRRWIRRFADIGYKRRIGACGSSARRSARCGTEFGHFDWAEPDGVGHSIQWPNRTRVKPATAWIDLVREIGAHGGRFPCGDLGAQSVQLDFDPLQARCCPGSDGPAGLATAPRR